MSAIDGGLARCSTSII